MEPLTPSQQQLYDFITHFINQHGFAPTHRELSDGLGLKSTNSIRRQLNVLERKGYIEIKNDISRGINLLSLWQSPRLPLVGTVAAGLPIEAIENVERYINIDPATMSPMPDYLLTVAGDSMINAGILDGDIVGVKKTQDVQHGQLVIARQTDSVTLKRLHWQDDDVRLIAENPAYADMPIHNDEWQIEGVYCGLIRSHA